MNRIRVRFSSGIIALGVWGLALGLLAGGNVLIYGQSATEKSVAATPVAAKPAVAQPVATKPAEENSTSEELPGVVDDWSHHHLIFSNPGTAEDAYKDGRYEEWLRITADPRYKMQQIKRGAVKPAAVAVPGIAEESITDDSIEAKPAAKSKKPTLKKDWSMSYGGSSSAVGSGTFTGNPASGTITITDGANHTTLTASPDTAATGSITLNSTSSFCFQNGQNVIVAGTTFETLATAGTGSFTISNSAAPSGSVTIGNVTYNFVTALSSGSNQVLVPTGSWSGTKATETAENLAYAIDSGGDGSACGYGSPCTHSVTANTAVSSGTAASNTETLTALCADNAGITLTNGTNVSFTSVAAGTAGSNNTSSAPYTFSLNTSSSATPASYITTATNLFNDINNTTATHTLVTATNPSSGVVDLQATSLGTGSNFTLTTTGTTPGTITVVAGTNGANGTNTGTDFETTGVLATDATNLAAAITRNTSANVPVNGASSGATVYVYDTTDGTGGDTITLTSTLNTGFTAWSGTALTGGDTGVVGNMGAGVYPAKYSFSVTGTPTCSDFVVYNTGVTGSSTGPTIIAYDNLYEGASPACGGTTGTAGVPTVSWQYNTAYPYVSSGTATADGSKIVTSVVLSGDGKQVAFIESNSTPVASLVLLKPLVNSPALVQMDNTTYNVTAANYPTCSAPCMTRITLNSNPNDITSSPFYNYSSDILYVGDALGKLHQFTHVFNLNGANDAPAEDVTCGSQPCWPVLVNSTGNALTSPVYDGGTTNIFVANEGSAGYLYSVPSTGTPTPVQSYQLAVSPGVVDGPVVDPTAEEVYVFVSADINGSNTGNSPCKSTTSQQVCNGVFQFSATTSLSGASLSEDVLGVTASTPNVIYHGAFDQIYYASTSHTSPIGSLYACGSNGSNEPKLSQIPISSNAFSGSTGGSAIPNGGVAHLANNIVNPMTTGTANCSPVTEFYNTTPTATDYIFLSVSANGNDTNTGGSCSTSCIYSFNTTSTLTSSSKSAASMTVTNGTSGIIIDNLSTQAGASEVYFGTLGAQICGGNGEGAGTGDTGGCAIQAAQNGL
jgi:hypothetical protein